MKTTLSLVAVSFCVLAACNSNEDLDSAQSIHQAPAPALASATTLGVGMLSGFAPATPAGNALLWTLERLNLSPAATNEDAILTAFDPSVLEQVSATSLASELQRIGGQRPFALIGFVEPPTDSRIVAALMSRNGFDKLTVEVGPTGKLTTVLFEELPPGDGSEVGVPARGLPLMLAEAPGQDPVPAVEGEGEGSAAPAPAEGSGEAAPE